MSRVSESRRRSQMQFWRRAGVSGEQSAATKPKQMECVGWGSRNQNVRRGDLEGGDGEVGRQERVRERV